MDQLSAFKNIRNFVNDLSEVFNKTKSILYYKKIINMTTEQNTEIIKRHVSVFENFCKINSECILTKDDSKLIEDKILYSERIYINMRKVLREVDAENKNIIYQHLLTIHAILIPDGGAREKLKETKINTGDKFMNDIISKVQNSSVANTNNPTEALTNMLQSGVLTDIMSSMEKGMSSGQLNIGQLLGSMQGMLGNLQNMSGDNQGDNKTPDLSGMMQMVSTMLPAMMSSFSAGNTGNTGTGNSENTQ